MRRRTILICALVGLATCGARAQDGGDEKPPIPVGARTVPEPPESRDALLAELKAARRTKDADRQIDAMLSAFYAPDDEIVREVGRYLRSRDERVRLEALRALRYLDHPKALELLVALANSQDTFQDTSFAAQVLYAVGQYGNARTVPALVAHANVTEYAVWVARLRALANVRDRRAVEALVDLFTRSRIGSTASAAAHIHQALHVLTGERFDDPRAWIDWWKNRPVDWAVPPVASWLDDDERRQLGYLWNVPGDLREARRRGLPKDAGK